MNTFYTHVLNFLCSLCSYPFQLVALRGTVWEEAIPSTAKHNKSQGIPLRDLLEYVVPDLPLACLRLAPNTPKITEQLAKLDEQGVGINTKQLCCPIKC